MSSIELELLSAIAGDTKLYLENDDPEKRSKLAELIREQMKAGTSVFLIQGDLARRIKDYDPETNEWIVIATPSEAPRREGTRVSARYSRAIAIPPRRGG